MELKHGDKPSTKRRDFENKYYDKYNGQHVNKGSEDTNREIRYLYNSTDIVCEIKCRRIRWAGNILKRRGMSPDVMKSNPEVRQPCGRPKER